MWSTAFTILHIFACIFLVVVVLLQTGKGTDVNAVFGGSSQTIFGSSGAGTFLTKLTTATAAVFMATSLFLTYGTARQTTKSIFDETPPPAVTTPATPEQTPAVPGGTSGTGSDKPAEAPATSQTAPVSTPPATPPSPAASAAPVTVTTSSTSVTSTETAKPSTPAAMPAETAKTPAPSSAEPTKPK